MTISASFTASALTVAPAALNSESGRPDFSPAPGSTATSTPSALKFFTVSGEAATRGSDGSISLATAIFMRPPAGRAREILEHDPEKLLPVFQAQTTSRSAVTVHPELIAIQRNSSTFAPSAREARHSPGSPSRATLPRCSGEEDRH